MTPTRAAVLDLTSSLHNWRRDPSPDNMRSVILAGDVVCGHALELEQHLALEVEKVPLPRELCKCGGTFHPSPASFPVPTLLVGIRAERETCNACGLHRVTVLVHVGATADAG